MLSLAVAATGCTEQDGPATTIPSGTAASTSTLGTTTTTIPVEQAVRASWQAFWADSRAAAAAADWRSPRLAQHATGKALANLQAQFQELRRRGWVARGRITVHPPRELHVRGSRATLRGCVDTTQFIRMRRTGQPVDTPGGRPDDMRAVLVLQNGRWKVTETEMLGKCAD